MARERHSPESLLSYLDALNIETHTVSHPPVFTVDESRRLRGDLPGGHCKSLFLRDKKRRLWLLVTLESRRIDLKALKSALGASKSLSFASPELLFERLAVQPGAVTPFALINDTDRRVQVVLDEAMLAIDPLNYHPLENDRTTAISPKDLLRFIRSCGHEPNLLHLEG